MKVYLVFDSDAEPGVPFSAHISRVGAIAVAKECASSWYCHEYPPNEKDTETQFFYSCEDHSVYVTECEVIG